MSSDTVACNLICLVRINCVLACGCTHFQLFSSDQAVPCVLACSLEDIFTWLHAISVISFGSRSTLCTCLQLGRYLHMVTCNFSYFVQFTQYLVYLPAAWAISSHGYTPIQLFQFGSNSTLCTCLQHGEYLHTVTRNFSYFVRIKQYLVYLPAAWKITSHVISFGLSSTLCTCLQLGGYLHPVTRKFSHFIRIRQYLVYLPKARRISSHGYMQFQLFR